MSVALLILTFLLNAEVTICQWPGSANAVFGVSHSSLRPELQTTLESGVQLAMENCQHQFKWDRWNCPVTAFSGRNRGSTTGTTKEYAYVLSITSAAVTYVVTRGCSRGNISGCECTSKSEDETGGKDWVWGGCSDVTEYGEEASRKYLDDTEQGIDALTYTNLHNYRVGREVVRKSLTKRCKCHGMSGSCTMKSCWMQMGKFRDLSHHLRKRYDNALRVDFEEGEGKIVVGNSVSGNTLSEIPKTDTEFLVYLQESPNYCLANNTTGWRGTLGRSCSRDRGEGVTASEQRSCRHLCKKCGHSVKKKRRTVTRHCNCVFKSCCEVQCKQCSETAVEHFCAR